MNSSTPFIRFGLFALAGSILLAAAVLQSRVKLSSISAPTALPVVTLGTITIRPDAPERAGAAARTSVEILPVLPTVHVRASEEEIIAATIDPTDQIQVLATISVRPDADEIAADMQPILNNATVRVDEDGSNMMNAVFTKAAAQQHRLRLDMPYYSFGRVLSRAQK